MKLLLIVGVIFLIYRFFKLGILSFNADAAKKELEKKMPTQPGAPRDEYISYEEVEE